MPNFRGPYLLDPVWKANSSIIVTGLVSLVSWFIYIFAVTSLNDATVGSVYIIIAILSLIRFGQLLDKRLEGII